jgi:hypothetical protein
MATHKGFLAPGMDGHVVRLGIGHKGIRKIWGKPHYYYFFGVLTFSFVDNVAIRVPKHHYSFAYSSLITTTDTFSTAEKLSPSSFLCSLH